LKPRETILVTGATGYIGGRLVPRLLAAGYRVRCLVREPRKLGGRSWAGHPRVEIVAGDLDDSASVERAMDGCWAAYYLVHSMLVAGADYAEHDRRLAGHFAAAAAATPSMQRIVYLGGRGETGPDLSEHLSSRREVEKALASGSVPVTTLRAAMIVGSGSASFEILRYLRRVRDEASVSPRTVERKLAVIAALSEGSMLGLAVALGLTTLLWLVSLLKRDASIIDVFWGPSFAVLAWRYRAGVPQG
jgi:uncharacterized protein YbjT (DUF2867 family)